MTRDHVETLVYLEECRDDERGVTFVGLHPARILLNKSRDESLAPSATKLLVNAAGHAQLAKQLYEWCQVPEANDTL